MWINSSVSKEKYIAFIAAFKIDNVVIYLQELLDFIGVLFRLSRRVWEKPDWSGMASSKFRIFSI